MANIAMITTTAGRAAITAALAESSSINVQDAQLSGVAQTVTAATTAITNVVATLPVVASVRAAGSGFALHLVLTDDSSAVYDVRTVAIRLVGGTYLLVGSRTAVIATKSAESSLHLAFDLTIDAALASTIAFGDTDYILPMASATAPGMVELATGSEVFGGADGVRAVTPAGLKNGVNTNRLWLATGDPIAYTVTVQRTVNVPIRSFFAAPVDLVGNVGNVAIYLTEDLNGDFSVADKGVNAKGYAMAPVRLPTGSRIRGLDVRLSNPNESVQAGLYRYRGLWSGSSSTYPAPVLQSVISKGGRRTVSLTDLLFDTLVDASVDEHFVMLTFFPNGYLDIVDAVRVIYDDPGPRNH